jgi:hypothetical protein
MARSRCAVGPATGCPETPRKVLHEVSLGGITVVLGNAITCSITPRIVPAHRIAARNHRARVRPSERTHHISTPLKGGESNWKTRCSTSSPCSSQYPARRSCWGSAGPRPTA